MKEQQSVSECAMGHAEIVQSPAMADPRNQTPVGKLRIPMGVPDLPFHDLSLICRIIYTWHHPLTPPA